MNSSRQPETGPGAWYFCRNGLIALFIFVLLLDTMPTTGAWHEKPREWVEPLLDKTGLWQGTWNLFAPMPAKINTAMSADIQLADGSLIYWTSPDPKTWTLWQKFRNFRWSEYWDSIRLDDYREGWPALADWLARQYEAEGLAVRRVRLYRSWAVLGRDVLAEGDPFPFSTRRMIVRKEYPAP